MAGGTVFSFRLFLPYIFISLNCIYLRARNAVAPAPGTGGSVVPGWKSRGFLCQWRHNCS